MSAIAAPGVYGKLPARGDFISRRLARSFIDPWDGWLQQAILASREALQSRWLEIYLTSPIWRFALGAGSCGPNTVLGVLMPSVDKVGRYFPLMLGQELPGEAELTAIAVAAGDWYQAMATLALSALADEFRIETLELPLAAPLPRPTAALAATTPLPSPGLYVAIDPALGFAESCRAGGPAAGRSTLWWTSGSEQVAPCLLVCPGLPAPAAFAAMLDGVWEPRGWTVAAAPALTEDGSAGLSPSVESA